MLTQTLHDLKKHSRELLEEIAMMVEVKASEGDQKPHEVIFSRREVREYTKWSDWKVRECMTQLVDLEYIRAMGGSQGKQCAYQISGLIPYNEFSLNGLTSPEKLSEIFQRGSN